jgi:hypothetical protein
MVEISHEPDLIWATVNLTQHPTDQSQLYSAVVEEATPEAYTIWSLLKVCNLSLLRRRPFQAVEAFRRRVARDRNQQFEGCLCC